MKSRIGLIFSVILLGTVYPAGVFAQANTPAYIAEMPSVDSVMKAMQASDPDETAARQMGAFMQLKTMIEELAGPRYYRPGLTPEETKLRQAYYTAYYQISQSKQQYKSFLAMRGYDIDPKFRNELIQKVFPPTFAAEYPKLVAQAKGQNQALHNQAEQIRAQQAAKDQADGQKAYRKLQEEYEAGRLQMAPALQSPEQRALNRCITAGRPAASCAGNTLLGGFTQLMSQFVPGMLSKERPPGAIMSGVFVGAGGWRVDFITDGVLVNCSMLSPNQQNYIVEFKNGRTQVVIDTTPKALVLTLTAEGNLVGPGPIEIDGVVPGGYTRGTSNATQQDSFGNKYDSLGNRAIETPGYTTFAPKTTTCSAQNLSSKGASVGIETMELNVLKMVVGADQGPPIPPGVRMHGAYAAQSGFNVEFYDESVIVACGEPARAYPYHVVANGSQTAVKVDDPGHPLLLNIRSDGSLDPGTGQYLVHGRRIIGKDENDDFKFAPLEATCNLGVLVPGAGAGAPAGARMTASTAPAGSSGAATGNAVLSVVSGFATQPGVANPFAGRTFVLLRDNFDNVLAKGGFSVPAGVQPYKAMILACSQRAPDCQKASAAISAQTATGGKLDATGKAAFSGVAPGSYYLMGSALAGGQALMWNVKVDLKAGANSVMLDQRNATPVK